MKRSWVRRGAIIGSSFAILLVLLLFLQGPASGQRLDQLRFVFWGPPLIDGVVVFVAQENGYFKDEGIDFKFESVNGSAIGLQQLIAGNADVVDAGPETTLITMSQSKVQLRGIYNMHVHNPFLMVADKRKGFNRVEDLKGHTIGIGSLASVTRWNAVALLRKANLRESDVNMVVIGSGAWDELIPAGRIDAASTYDTYIYDVSLRNPELARNLAMWWIKDIQDSPGDMFVTRADYVTSKRSLLVRFLRAVRHAANFIVANPATAAKITQKYAVDGKDLGRNLEVIKILNARSQDAGTSANGLGWYSRYSDIQKLIDFYNEQQLISIRPKPEEVFTNELLRSVPKQP